MRARTILEALSRGEDWRKTMQAGIHDKATRDEMLERELKNMREYYESDEFLDQYKEALWTRYIENEDVNVAIIKDKWNKEPMIHRVEQRDGGEYRVRVGQEEAQWIYDHVKDNIEDYTERFGNYYTGYWRIESVTIGEVAWEISEKWMEEYLEEEEVVSDGMIFNDMSSEGFFINLDNEKFPEAFMDYLQSRFPDREFKR